MNEALLRTNAQREVTIIRKPGDEVVEEICNLNWSGLSKNDLINVAWIYYYFSVQFRENLEIACRLLPDDEQLQELDKGERNTDNLSPYPGVVATSERVNHDEFMRRTLDLTPIEDTRRHRLEDIGAAYLRRVRAIDTRARATSLASYEDGGLEKVFTSILKATNWNDPLLLAFKHFLEKHIEFDSDVESGHGGLCRHLPPDEHVPELWIAFKESLVRGVPALKAQISANP